MKKLLVISILDNLKHHSGLRFSKRFDFLLIELNVFIIIVTSITNIEKLVG